MKERKLSMPLVALIGATRGMLGIGIGLLIAPRLEKDHRKVAGAVLAAIGALSTIPLALRVFWRDRPQQIAPSEQPAT